MTDTDDIEFIKGVACFAGLTDAEFELLDGYLTRREVAVDEHIIHEDDVSDTSMFVLVSGRLSIRMSFRDGHTPDMADVEPGELFGEMAMLTGQPRSATVIAREPSTVIEISPAGIQMLIRSRPEIGDQIRSVIADRQAENLKTVMGLANERSG